MLNDKLCCPSSPQITIKRKWKIDKYIDLARKLKNTMEHEGDGDTNCIWCTWNNPPKLIKAPEDFKIGG